jgi:transposase
MEGERFVGVDLGKRTYEACAIARDGSMERWNGRTNGEGRERLASRLRTGDIVVVEAGSTAFHIARRLQTVSGVRVLVLNPGKLAVIYASMKKTDKEDALKLARLVETMREEYLPTVPLPSEAEEEMRRLAGMQVFLKQERTRLINRLHAVFVAAGKTTVTKKHLAGDGSRRDTVEMLFGVYAQIAGQLVAILAEVEQQIAELDRLIRAALIDRREQAALLMSIPGVGPVATMTFLGYVGDGSRFETASQVSYYAGLVPRLDISGETQRLGHITKSGNPTIRRVMIQAAWAAIRSSSGRHFRDVFERIAATRGRGIAIVAVGRRILELMYTLITRGEYYQYNSLAERLRKLRYYKMVIEGTGST